MAHCSGEEEELLTMPQEVVVEVEGEGALQRPGVVVVVAHLLAEQQIAKQQGQ